MQLLLWMYVWQARFCVEVCRRSNIYMHVYKSLFVVLAFSDLSF